MSPHQERVVEEKKELDIKLEKLHAFLMSAASKELHVDDTIPLIEQELLMEEYSEVLARRIARF